MEKLDELLKIICSINKKEQLQKLFEELFTPAEIKDFSLRLALMKMLSEGKPQREISSELGVSLCKITRGAKIIKDKDSIFHKILIKKENI